jgi:GNAT superfamily N-acetyltransferase
MTRELIIRPFGAADARAVKDLFYRAYVALDLPPAYVPILENHIQSAIQNDLGRITEYYGERNGGFWVAEENSSIMGMFGIAESAPAAMELKRMCVAPEGRGRGIGRTMLAFAEAECRRRGAATLHFETSEFNREALPLYVSAGFQLDQESIIETPAGQARVFHFSKSLQQPVS